MFYSGDLFLFFCNMLSVVGGRCIFVLVKKIVYYLLKLVVEVGYVIVSGCVKGIDIYSY